MNLEQKTKPQSILKSSARPSGRTNDVFTPSSQTNRVPKIVLTKTMVYSKDALLGPLKDPLTDSESSQSEVSKSIKSFRFFRGINEPQTESATFIAKADLALLPKKTRKLYEKQSQLYGITVLEKSIGYEKLKLSRAEKLMKYQQIFEDKNEEKEEETQQTVITEEDELAPE